MYSYQATVTRIVDGDTLDLSVDLGFKVKIEIRVRLFGVDTPEVYGVKKESEEFQKGKAASRFVQEWLDSRPKTLLINTIRDTKGKYGRYLATIVDPDSKESLNEALVKSGHAVEVLYD